MTAETAPAARLGPRLSPAGGIEITGADLSLPVSTIFATAIRQTLFDHGIIVIRDQA